MSTRSDKNLVDLEQEFYKVVIKFKKRSIFQVFEFECVVSL